MLRCLLSLAALLLVALAGCSDPSPDGDSDSDADQDSDQDEDWDLDIEPPAPPVLTPCPQGWVEVPPEDPTDPYDVANCDPWPEEGPAKLTPCPAGWREIPRTEPGGVATCDPWPEGGMQECEGDQAHFPGEPGCRRIGSECPEGEWADGLPETGVVYVRAGGASGGIGTRASPFGAIAEATAVATEGTIIALSKGTFDEAVVLPAGLTLRGACVRDTVVAWSGAAEIDATITVQSSDTSLRDLTVGGEGQGVLVEGEGALLDVQGVLVSGARRAGLFVREGGALSGADLVVRSTRGMREPDPEFPEADNSRGYGLWIRRAGRAEIERAVVAGNRANGVVAIGAGTGLRMSDAVVAATETQDSDRTGGYGVNVQEGAEAELRGVTLERNRTAGLFAGDAGTLVLVEDLVVRDTMSEESSGDFGEGIVVSEGAALEGAAALVAGNRQTSVYAYGAATSVVLTDLVARDTLSQQSDLAGGFGICVQAGAQAAVSRCLVERSLDAGVLVEHSGSLLVLEDALVRDTLSRESDRRSGAGLSLQSGGRAEVARALVERSRTHGVFLRDAGTAIVLRDAVIADTLPQLSDQAQGRGLEISSGAQAEVARALFERNRDTGLLAGDPDTTLSLEDVVVRDTVSQQSDRLFGEGLWAQVGAHLELTRAILERNRTAGVVLYGEGAAASLHDLVVRDTQSQEPDGRFGRGLIVQEGASAEVTRAILAGNRDLGIGAFDPGSDLTLSHIVVEDTLESECASGACVGAGGGRGVGAYAEAHLEMTRFLVTRSAMCGLQVSHGIQDRNPSPGAMDLHEGEVSYNPIGANVHAEAFDLDRLMDGVVYRDNGRNLDTDELPIPDVVLPPGLPDQ